MSRNAASWFTLIQAVASIEAELAGILQARHGLGLSEYRALEILAQTPAGELRMQELASHLRLNQSSVSRMVERLERSGLAKRDLCADDKRGVYAVLTDNGRAQLQSARHDYEQALDKALKEQRCKELLAAGFIHAA